MCTFRIAYIDKVENLYFGIYDERIFIFRKQTIGYFINIIFLSLYFFYHIDSCQYEEMETYFI